MRARRRPGPHPLAGAHPFAATVQRRVGHVPGSIVHLWHGDLTDRGSARR
jgi:hypothetical protein